MKNNFLRYGVFLFVMYSAVVIGNGTVYCERTLNDVDKVNVLHQIPARVRSDYVEMIDMNTLYDSAIQGMIDKLDPHSSYMPPSTSSEFNEKIRGNFQGIGITFSILNDKINVIDIIENGPSEVAGLKSRDKIVQIDGENAVGISEEEVKNRLRGRSGSKVVVHVERPGEKKLTKITIIRNKVDINSVSHAYMLDDTIGYAALTRFSINTKWDLEKTLENLKSQGMKKFILDLRNNSGGSLDAAIGVVDLFINEGIIVSVKGRRESQNSEWKASSYPQYTDMPMIVLINHGSASASEIVAGALQDHDRALILGQTSFGKGLVMNPFSLRFNKKSLGTLMLSVARYYTPSGRLIQRPYDGSKEEYIKEGFDDYDPNAEDVDKEGRPVYYTDLGREVYGGGGITPDTILMPLKRLNSLEIELRKSNLFFEFSDNYLIRMNDIPEKFEDFLNNYRIPAHEFDLYKQYILSKGIEIDTVSSFREELKTILKKFDIPEENLETVEQSLVDNGIDLDEMLFEKSKDFIEREIKQEIARMLWGTEERYKVWHTDDTQLIESLSYFNEAEDLLKKHLAMQSEGVQDE